MNPASPVIFRHTTQAVLIFDLEDAYAREQRFYGPHPRPLAPLRFWLVGQTVNGVRTLFDVPIEMIVKQNQSGYHLFFGQVRLSDVAARLAGAPQKSSRLLRLADGDHTIRITSPFYQAAERDDLTVPMADPNHSPGTPYHFDLLPGCGYPFANTLPLRPEGIRLPCGSGSALESSGPTLLRGSLHEFDGAPVVGAQVSIAGMANSPACTTDATGQWILVFPSGQRSGPVSVRIVQPSVAQPVIVADVCIIKGRDMSLAETGLRGVVLRRGMAVRNAVVAVTGAPQPVNTGSDGVWSCYFPPNQASTVVDVTVTLPEGPSLTVTNVEVRARSTTVVPAFNFA